MCDFATANWLILHSFLPGLALVWLAGRIAPGLSLVDHPSGDPLKVHRTPVPLTGGLGILAAAAAGIAASGLLGPWDPTPRAILLLGFGGAFLLLGTLDDLFRLSPAVRIGAVLLFSLPFLQGAWLPALPVPGIVNAIIALAMISGAVNALNLVDGLDGLAGGCFAFTSLALASFAWDAGDLDSRVLSLLLFGAVMAFLAWNRPPAALFLGNGGSHLLGGMTGIIALGVLSSPGTGFVRLAAVVLVIGFPVFDTAWAIIRRRVSASRVSGGDRNHIYDRLAARLGSVPRGVAASLAIHALLVLAGTALWRLS
jgi:UDP-GlcNAc:undecaprenyl-phosphate GlcNAc-1-phosphate transferase